MIEDVNKDYGVSDSKIGKQYHIKDHVKHEAHPDFKKHTVKNITDP